MFSEEMNGTNPEEVETAETCETVEESVAEEVSVTPEPEETVTPEEETAEMETPAEEPQENKQSLLDTVKEKWAAFVQKVSSLFPAKAEPADATAVEETAEESAVEETTVEEVTEENATDETVVEETTEENTAKEIAVEETVEENAAEEPVVEGTSEETDEQDNAVEKTVEETATEDAEAAQTAEDESEGNAEDLFSNEKESAVPAQKKLNPLQLGLAIAGGVLLVCALVFAVLRATGIDLKPRENNLLYNDCYTVEGEKLAKKADVVVATIGDKELTLSELQLYYINSIYSFYSQNYYYLDYMGLNMEVPLSEQPCTMDTTLTWEQYFLDGTIKSWQSYALVEMMAEQDGFTVTEEVQAQIDSMASQLESIAVAYGYPDAATYLATEMAPGVTPDTYLHFNEVYYVTNEYLADFYEKDYPTDAEILIYHAQNRETFEANGIVPDMGLLSNVRHILIQPMGGTVSEDGMETVYSEDEWNTALSEAERILEAWKSGEATESSFATMANTYSEDPGSNTTGGLYEAIDPFSNYVPEFLNWAVDMNRQPGDTEIVKTSYGYHIMYFVSGQDYFNYVVGEQLVADRIQTKLKVLQGQYPLEVDYKKIMLCEPVF